MPGLNELNLVTCGMADCEMSLDSIAEATCNAKLADVPIDSSDGTLRFYGMAITQLSSWTEDGTTIVEIKPKSSMNLFVSWLMEKLPSTACVEWRNGWPFVHCPAVH